MACGRGAGLGTACASTEGISKQLQRSRTAGWFAKGDWKGGEQQRVWDSKMLTRLGAHKDWCAICYSGILMYWLTEKRGEIML